MGFWVKKHLCGWILGKSDDASSFFFYSKQLGWTTCRAPQMEQKEKRA